MSFGREQYSKRQKADAERIRRRKPRTPDPERIGECFPGDMVEIPFLGLCVFAFRISRQGFVRLRDNNPARTLYPVPNWVPVVCVQRYRKNERD